MKFMKSLDGFEIFSVYSEIYETYVVVLQFQKLADLVFSDCLLQRG
jgi:hypothetical protein